MSGIEACKLYIAAKLHFTTEGYDVIANNGGVKYRNSQIESRNDYRLFEAISQKHKDIRELCSVYVANFAYNNPGVVYDLNLAEKNYLKWIGRQQSITRLFENDIKGFGCSVEDAIKMEGLEPPLVFMMYLADKVMIETLVILDSEFKFLDKMRDTFMIGDLYREEILKIRKLRPFVKFDSKRVHEVIQNVQDSAF